MVLEVLFIEWEGGNVDYLSVVFDVELDEGFIVKEVYIGNKVGDVEVVFVSVFQVVEVMYCMLYQNYVCMELMNVIVLWMEDKCEVWCLIQNGENVFVVVVEVVGLFIEQCEVYKVYLGGGFGCCGVGDYVVQVINFVK